MNREMSGAGTIAKKRKIAIIGPANAGKSVIFNNFTNFYSTVANYSQTTIESIRKESVIGGETFDIYDTPGLASLNICAEDEGLTKDTLLKSSPDIILFTADATRIKRSLALLAQIMELGIPTVLALNKVDEASGKGIVINAQKLAAELGIPVVETAAIHELGLDKIESAIQHSYACIGKVKYSNALEKTIREITEKFPEERKPSRGFIALFMSGDQVATSILDKLDLAGARKARETLARLRRLHPSLNIKRSLFNAREAWADKVSEEITAMAPLTAHGFANRAAWVSRHPVFGWPIVFAIAWATFYGVGTIATEMAGYLDGWIFIPLTNIIDGMVSHKLLNEFLVGDFGLVTMGVMNAVVTVVPILIVFFLIVNFLEDVGYLPNLSVLMNRMFSYLGLTGKSTLSMSLGFGCNTMATLTSRMLETKKERIIVSSLVALGIPCAVQLGVMIAILSTAPFSALLWVVGSVIVTQIVAGLALNRFIKSDKTADFIIELPSFRWPSWKNIVRKTYHRVREFLVEALPMFMFGAALMFVLEKTGGLAIIKKIAAPIITGFLSMPDKTTEVFILVLSRRELGAVYFKDMVDAAQVDYYQVVVGLTVMTLFIPCISNTMVMIKELGMKLAVSINMTIMVIAILVGGLLNSIIRLF